MKIIVNGTHVDVAGPTLSYEDVVKLAGKSGYPSVTYRGPLTGDARREGSMHRGQAIRVEPEMVFNAIHTGNA